MKKLNHASSNVRNGRSKNCRSCSTSIPSSARRCSHCHASQGRFSLSDTSTIISSLAAAISVLAAGWPVAQKFFSPPYAQLDFRLMKISGPISASGHILVSAKNKGSKSGYIWAFATTVKKDRKKDFDLPIVYEFYMMNNSFEDKPVPIITVPPRGEVTFFAKMKPYTVPQERQGDASCKASVAYYGGKSDFEFESGSSELPINCTTYLPFESFSSFDEVKEMLRATGNTEALHNYEEAENKFKRQPKTLGGTTK